MLTAFLFLVFNTLCVCAKHEYYMGHKVYNVKFDTEKQQNNLFRLKRDIVDFWRKPSLKHNITGQVMVPPSHIEWFEETLGELDIKRDVHLEDVFMHLNDINSPDTTEENDETEEIENGAIFDFESYHRYDVILNYLKAIENEYANSTEITVNIIEAGITDEGRPIVYLQITSNDNFLEKPIVVIEAGIIPREWITIPSALNIVKELLNDTQRSYLNDLQWIVIPVLNPDGYEYTHTNLRLWMKSRSIRTNLGFICPGVNINRNFGIDWQFSDTSSSPCSHLFGGDEEFSEPESRVIQNLIEEYGRRIRMYISLQNSGGFISYPWLYERAASGMFRQHHLLGLEMIAELGPEYKLDSGSLALGDRASGTSTDYVMENGVLYTFNLDIAGEGTDSVMIPETEITLIADKVWKAVAVAAESIAKL